MPLRLTSDAFEPGGPVPTAHTCVGENISPGLRFSGVPESAGSLVLILDDPDAPNGVFAHWVLYNLPVELDQLEPGFTPDLEATDGPAQGRNDFGNNHYEGPCPPAGGDEHHYYFRLYALDQRLELSSGATRAQVLDALQGHVLDQTEASVTFRRAAVPAERLGQGTPGWDFEFYSEVPDLSAAEEQRLRAEAEARLGELTRGNQDMIGASVAVEPVAAGQDGQPHRFRARVVVFIRPDNLAASEQADSYEAALQQVLDATERLVREQRAKLREPHKHT